MAQYSAATMHRDQGRRHGVDWVDMSNPLLPEVVPQIVANPVSFYSGGGGLRVGFSEFAKHGE